MSAILGGLLSAFGFCIGVGCLIGFCKWLWDGCSCSKEWSDEFIARQQPGSNKSKADAEFVHYLWYK